MKQVFPTIKRFPLVKRVERAHSSDMKSADQAILIAASLLMASFVLGNFVDIYQLPAGQGDFMEWISWILGIGGIVLFLSGIVTHKNRR